MDDLLLSRVEMLLLRDDVERFLGREAKLLDGWQLEEWLTLYADECNYIIAPTGEDPVAILSTDSDYFIASDDRFRVEQRALRLLKTSAHAEYPHSLTRHIYSNIAIESRDGDRLVATCNFVTFRSRGGQTTYYVGQARYDLLIQDDTFRITEKYITLDHDSLVMQGKLSIIL